MKATRQAKCIPNVDKFLGDGIWQPVDDKFTFPRQGKETTYDERCHFNLPLTLRRLGIIPHNPLAVFILHDRPADIDRLC